ncbi:MAG: DUF3999 family protein [Kiritimatiellia bacterium]|jgi:hypothetical protein|nr:DUF3999 domain-containing protein [Lentisphaerota bacterium]
MKKASTLPAILLPAILLAALTAAAATPADFRVTRDIYRTPLTAPHPVEIHLDAPIFAQIQTNNADLRLFDSSNRELPRLIEPLSTTQTQTQRHPAAAQTRTLQELPNNSIEARLELDEKAPAADGITIQTPLKDFIRTVLVSGSDDGKLWRPLAEAEIFDYTRYMDIRNTDIPLPKNNCRHFSITIRNASEERAQPLVHLIQAQGQNQQRAYDLLRTPFRMDAIQFWHETTHRKKDQPITQEWPPAHQQITQNRKTRATEITLQTDYAPITRLILETADRNFQRTARIQVPALINGRPAWRTIADAKPAMLDLPGCTTNRLTMDFPEQRAPRLRLLIDNADNPPLAITALRPHGPTYRLIWLAHPEEPYRLAYGNPALPAPAYDLYPIRTALDQDIQPTLWTLAPAPETTPPRGGILQLFTRPAIFGALLGLATLALLLLLAKALQKTPATDE